MKKYLLILFGLFSFLHLSSQQGIHISLGAMPQNTWILNNDDKGTSIDSFKYRATWGYAGMFKLGYNIGDPFGIHVGVLYSSQGQSNSTRDSIGRDLRVTRSLKYIKVPLFLHFNSDPNDVMFSVEVGPQLNFILDADYLIDNSPVNPGFEYKEAFKIQNLSFAWSLGVDFRLTDGIYFNLTHRGDYDVFDCENKQFILPGTNQNFYSTTRSPSNCLNLGLMAGFTFTFLPDLGGQGQWWIR